MDIEAHLSDLSEDGRFSGAVLITRGTERLVERGYGQMDRERRVQNSPRTEFQIASISKQFTAAAVLLLQERGALSTRDPMCRWVPECPEAWKHVTIHQLLAHTSGIGHWQDFPDLSLFDPSTVGAVIETFRKAPLKFLPGTAWYYSSPAYVLLAWIVEQSSGEPYAEFLRRRIFLPLGMESTAAGNRAAHPERQAVGYEDGEPVRSFELDVVGMGAGDIWSTVEDMERWDRAMDGPGLLSGSSLQAMFAPHATTTQSLPGESEARYGYGWFMSKLAGHRVIFHDGRNAGFRSLNARLVDDNAVVILLLNDVNTHVGLIDISMPILARVLSVADDQDS